MLLENHTKRSFTSRPSPAKLFVSAPCFRSEIDLQDASDRAVISTVSAVLSQAGVSALGQVDISAAVSVIVSVVFYAGVSVVASVSVVVSIAVSGEFHIAMA